MQAKLVSDNHSAIESFYVELTFHKKKALLIVPINQIVTTFLNIWILLVSPYTFFHQNTLFFSEILMLNGMRHGIILQFLQLTKLY